MDPKEPKDRHLDIPSEANRDKHANFMAANHDDEDPAIDNEEIRSDDEHSRDGKGNMLNANHTDPDVMTGRGLEENK